MRYIPKRHNSEISLDEMLEAGVHFGHLARRWHPKMAPYIYTKRNGIHIIDVVQTARLLSVACRLVRDAAKRGETFLFVGTKRQAADTIAIEATRSNCHYVNHRWLGGMLTNWSTIKSRIERLKDLEARESDGALELLPKKDAAVLKKQLQKLRKYLNGIKNMKRLPDAVILVDPNREMNAVQECIKLGIPIICLVDTNCDPGVADLPIPANDDAITSIQWVLGRLADAIYEGYSPPVNGQEYKGSLTGGMDWGRISGKS
uniref:ribosomal protein S2 n=1 Tax=Streptofilum capillatum TaxID=2058781 RepID=UPI00286CE989|nr:ribosomal protein S2 [Streptofilum capillatum]WKT08538.1 ribosomal protein S2 [Streptofilum capillatum]WKT08637.1 ribosomal protein S2 [Streptofilum sp. BC4-VF8pt]WKT08736.1 ribosomal protein S2 [Streptofilum sp. ZNP2-VF4pt]